MNEPFDFDARVHARFREAFGAPQIIAGKDDQWELRPAPHTCAIHVLLNGMTNGVSLWVFDPHDRKDGVFNTTITSEDQIDGLVEQIRQRMAKTIRDVARADGEIESEVRGQRSEVRGQRSEVRGQRSEA